MTPYIVSYHQGWEKKTMLQTTGKCHYCSFPCSWSRYFLHGFLKMPLFSIFSVLMHPVFHQKSRWRIIFMRHWMRPLGQLHEAKNHGAGWFQCKSGKNSYIWDEIINYPHSVANKLLDIELLLMNEEATDSKWSFISTLLKDAAVESIGISSKK